MLYRIKNNYSKNVLTLTPSGKMGIHRATLEEYSEEVDKRSIWQLSPNHNRIDTGSFSLKLIGTAAWICHLDEFTENDVDYTTLQGAPEHLHNPIVFEFDQIDGTNLFRIYHSNKRQKLIEYIDAQGRYYPALADSEHANQTDSWSVLEV
ncbi:hypothetical protein [Ochrobactrum teleogrylli]|uniref:Uncharacterized protein n=1 Tax=Ochrobactrum teleogrylli TaxID=2479765 RepID=A0ABD5JVX7_9HYPH